MGEDFVVICHGCVDGVFFPVWEGGEEFDLLIGKVIVLFQSLLCSCGSCGVSGRVVNSDLCDWCGSYRGL